MSMFVVFSGTGLEGPDTTVAIATTQAAAKVFAENIYYGYWEEVPVVVETTSEAFKKAAEWGTKWRSEW